MIFISHIIKDFGRKSWWSRKKRFSIWEPSRKTVEIRMLISHATENWAENKTEKHSSQQVP